MPKIPTRPSRTSADKKGAFKRAAQRVAGVGAMTYLGNKYESDRRKEADAKNIKPNYTLNDWNDYVDHYDMGGYMTGEGDGLDTSGGAAYADDWDRWQWGISQQGAPLTPDAARAQEISQDQQKRQGDDGTQKPTDRGISQDTRGTQFGGGGQRAAYGGMIPRYKDGVSKGAMATVIPLAALAGTYGAGFRPGIKHLWNPDAPGPHLAPDSILANLFSSENRGPAIPSYEDVTQGAAPGHGVQWMENDPYQQYATPQTSEEELGRVIQSAHDRNTDPGLAILDNQLAESARHQEQLISRAQELQSRYEELEARYNRLPWYNRWFGTGGANALLRQMQEITEAGERGHFYRNVQEQHGQAQNQFASQVQTAQNNAQLADNQVNSAERIQRRLATEAQEAAPMLQAFPASELIEAGDLPEDTPIGTNTNRGHLNNIGDVIPNSTAEEAPTPQAVLPRALNIPFSQFVPQINPEISDPSTVVLDRNASNSLQQTRDALLFTDTQNPEDVDKFKNLQVLRRPENLPQVAPPKARQRVNTSNIGKFETKRRWKNFGEYGEDDIMESSLLHPRGSWQETPDTAGTLDGEPGDAWLRMNGPKTRIRRIPVDADPDYQDPKKPRPFADFSLEPPKFEDMANIGKGVKNPKFASSQKSIFTGKNRVELLDKDVKVERAAKPMRPVRDSNGLLKFGDDGKPLMEEDTDFKELDPISQQIAEKKVKGYVPSNVIPEGMSREAWEMVQDPAFANKHRTISPTHTIYSTQAQVDKKYNDRIFRKGDRNYNKLRVNIERHPELYLEEYNHEIPKVRKINRGPYGFINEPYTASEKRIRVKFNPHISHAMHHVSGRKWEGIPYKADGGIVRRYDDGGYDDNTALKAGLISGASLLGLGGLGYGLYKGLAPTPQVNLPGDKIYTSSGEELLNTQGKSFSNHKLVKGPDGKYLHKDGFFYDTHGQRVHFGVADGGSIPRYEDGGGKNIALELAAGIGLPLIGFGGYQAYDKFTAQPPQDVISKPKLLFSTPSWRGSQSNQTDYQYANSQRGSDIERIHANTAAAADSYQPGVANNRWNVHNDQMEAVQQYYDRLMPGAPQERGTLDQHRQRVFQSMQDMPMVPNENRFQSPWKVDRTIVPRAQNRWQQAAPPRQEPLTPPDLTGLAQTETSPETEQQQLARRRRFDTYLNADGGYVQRYDDGGSKLKTGLIAGGAALGGLGLIGGGLYASGLRGISPTYEEMHSTDPLAQQTEEGLYFKEGSLGHNIAKKLNIDTTQGDRRRLLANSRLNPRQAEPTATIVEASPVPRFADYATLDEYRAALKEYNTQYLHRNGIDITLANGGEVQRYDDGGDKLKTGLIAGGATLGGIGLLAGGAHLAGVSYMNPTEGEIAWLAEKGIQNPGRGLYVREMSALGGGQPFRTVSNTNPVNNMQARRMIDAQRTVVRHNNELPVNSNQIVHGWHQDTGESQGEYVPIRFINPENATYELGYHPMGPNGMPLVLPPNMKYAPSEADGGSVPRYSMGTADKIGMGLALGLGVPAGIRGGISAYRAYQNEFNPEIANAQELQNLNEEYPMTRPDGSINTPNLDKANQMHVPFHQVEYVKDTSPLPKAHHGPIVKDPDKILFKNTLYQGPGEGELDPYTSEEWGLTPTRADGGEVERYAYGTYAQQTNQQMDQMRQQMQQQQMQQQQGGVDPSQQQGQPQGQQPEQQQPTAMPSAPEAPPEQPQEPQPTVLASGVVDVTGTLPHAQQQGEQQPGQPQRMDPQIASNLPYYQNQYAKMAQHAADPKRTLYRANKGHKFQTA